MAKLMVVVDYGVCHPENCVKGICAAVVVCPQKVIRQESPYEMPEVNPSICMGCGLCAQSCPLKAIRML